ncbi:LysM peptidoglycan-binding domain-containing protein [Streptomyces sp. NPDC053367]|uniref:CIS tube protein n=1 Tax=Streptomyces sp. NPDC053367 TaxID=3365700 RepID=UPI0037D6AF68
MPSTPSPFAPVPAGASVSAALAKAEIINTSSGESFSVMYNPEELKLEQGNNFAEVGIPGLDNPPVQYVRGRARTLSMELFFDTYERGEDVRGYTGPIVRLLDKQPQTQAPPVLVFSLGTFQFRCVLVDAGQRFTMFLRDGTPVRSSLAVRLQEFVRVGVEVEQGVFFGSPTASGLVNRAAGAAGEAVGAGAGQPSVHLVVRGDTLSGLAGSYLGDPALWRDIALANGISDPFALEPGTRLMVPARRPGGPLRPRSRAAP